MMVTHEANSRALLTALSGAVPAMPISTQLVAGRRELTTPYDKRALPDARSGGASTMASPIWKRWEQQARVPRAPKLSDEGTQLYGTIWFGHSVFMVRTPDDISYRTRGVSSMVEH